MTIEILGLKTCDTCRTARKALPEAVFRDIRDSPLAPDEIAGLLARFGTALVNRSSTTWRALSEAERAVDPATLLARHPALMKRPVIRHGDSLLLGWTPATRAALGLA